MRVSINRDQKKIIAQIILYKNTLEIIILSFRNLIQD